MENTIQEKKQYMDEFPTVKWVRPEEFQLRDLIYIQFK